MVSINEKYNLNHIYHINTTSSVISIGSANSANTEELELFQKSLALASDLKRLPILRGIFASTDFSVAAPNEMNTSSIRNIKWSVELYNDDVESQDEGELLARWTLYCAQTNGVLEFVGFDMSSWDYEGGILLSDKVSIKGELFSSSNVATADFPADRFNGDVFLEIDWVPVSKSQLDDFIREHIYAKQD